MCELIEPTENVSWMDVDHHLSRLGKRRAGLDYEEALWILAAKRTQAHRRRGHRSLAEYLMHVLGHTGGAAHERIRVAEALPALPLLSAALRRGEIAWSAVREISRIATPETEGRWISAMTNKTCHQVQEAVAGRTKGQGPDDPADQRLVHRVLSFRLSAEAERAGGVAAGRDAERRSLPRSVPSARNQISLARTRLDDVKREVDPDLSDEQALLMVLHGEAPAPKRVKIEVVPATGEAFVVDGDRRLDVPMETAERAACDAISTHGSTVPAAVRRKVMREAKGRCEVCGTHRWLNLHHLHLQSEGGDHDPNGILAVCWYHHARVHEGLLRIEGTRSMGLKILYADGTPYGGRPSPEGIEAYMEAFRGLRAHGIPEGQAKAGLAQRPPTPP
jgi:hypothetical protein